ncbi:MAG TPA: hypothetical protein VHB50_10380, partial [Bryobacteraceae bacterium]|nr:hypothetical protein [Bryobacteraceae bacterium]
RIRIAWLGDSRAYWIGPDDAKQLTHDHSWVHEVVAAGELTAEEANDSKNAHAITRWLGADAPEDASPSIAEFEAPGPGFLLLCTDGLWNYAPGTEALADLARSSGSDAIAIARTLVSFANRSGGHDNITAAVFIWPEQSL